MEKRFENLRCKHKWALMIIGFVLVISSLTQPGNAFQTTDGHEEQAAKEEETEMNAEEKREEPLMDANERECFICFIGVY